MTDEEHMGRWFSENTKPQLAQYNARMDVARAYRGSPRWDRERAAAQREFHEATSEARKLYELAISDLEALGELSEQVDYALTQFGVQLIIEAA
jgi:hypothetical protein